MLNVIEAIEEKLQQMKDAIFFKDLRIKDLKSALAKAEAELEKVKGVAK